MSRAASSFQNVLSRTNLATVVKLGEIGTGRIRCEMCLNRPNQTPSSMMNKVFMSNLHCSNQLLCLDYLLDSRLLYAVAAIIPIL